MVAAKFIKFRMFIFIAPDHLNKVESSSSNVLTVVVKLRFFTTVVVTGLVFVRKLYQTYFLFLPTNFIIS